MPEDKTVKAMAVLYWTGFPFLLVTAGAAVLGAPESVLAGLIAVLFAIGVGMFALVVYASMEEMIAARRMRARVGRVLTGLGLVRWRWWRAHRPGFVVTGQPPSVEVRLRRPRSLPPRQDALFRNLPKLLAESDYRASGADDLSFRVYRRRAGGR